MAVAQDEMIPTLTHALERDVDLLLVEELTASGEFLAWFAGRAGWNGRPANWRVFHSKRRTRSRREIDIHVEIESDNATAPVVLLVENKLSDTEQPGQGESYQEEIRLLRPGSSLAACILVCPAQYASAWPTFARKFDTVITYEQISDYLNDRALSLEGETRRRLDFRSALLLQAAGKRRRGYTPVPNQLVGSFNQTYVQFLAELAPGIFPGKRMLGDAPPDESVSMIFDHNRSLAFLDDSIRPSRFAHEFGRNKNHRANYVAVTFPGWGVAITDMKDRMLNDTIGTGFKFSAKRRTEKRPRPGLTMSMPTPPVDNQGDFQIQKNSIVQGIAAAVRMREWLRDNQDILYAWRIGCGGAM